MEKKLTPSEIKVLEEKIGWKASAMIENSVLNQLKLYGLASSNTSNKSLQKSLKSEPRMGEVRLFRIATNMARYGYIHQEGFRGKRTGHIKKKSPKKRSYSVKEHTFYLTKRPFIEIGIEKSGAFEYLLEELGKVRMTEVSAVFNRTQIIIK